MDSKYLERILKARVYEVAIESPLDEAPRLSRRLGNRVLFKREDLQPVFSFKLRGAHNKISRLGPEAAARGVICASAGNHAQGVALAARRHGIRAVVVMPVTTPAIKVEAVRDLGGEILLQGDDYDAACAAALQMAGAEGLSFIHPFDDPEVIAGQGTIAMEILRQYPAPIDAIFVPVGGGGLIAGIAVYVKSLYPEIRIVGVEPDVVMVPDVRPEGFPTGVYGHLFGERHHAVLSMDKARRLLGFEPELGFEDGHRDTYAWFKKQGWDRLDGPLSDPVWRSSWDFDAEARAAKMLRGS